MEKEIHNCPTCGSEVIVEGNTTQYYVPVTKLISKYNDLYEIVRNKLEGELSKARDKAHENPTIPMIKPPITQQKTFRKMSGNIWADESNFQYEEINGNFIKTRTAR